MESTNDKNSANKLERTAIQRSDASYVIQTDALNRAALQVESELKAFRFYPSGDRHEPPGRSTLRDHLRVLFRHQPVFWACVLAVTGAIALGLEFQTPMYEARVKMLISGEKQIQASYYREIGGYRNVPIVLTQSEIVNSDAVLQKAARALDLYARPLDYEKGFASAFKGLWLGWGAGRRSADLDRLPAAARQSRLQRMAEDDLRGRIRVEPVRDTNLFHITVRDFSPVQAAAAANVVSRAYAIFDIEQQLAELQLKYGERHSAVIELQDSIAAMTRELNGRVLPNIEAIGPASVKIIEQARVPLEPVRLPKALIWIAGLLSSVLLGVILAFLFDSLDPTFKTPQEVEAFLNVPLLGSVAKNGFRDLGSRKSKAGSLYTRSYENLSDHIYLLAKYKNLRTVLFSAASARDKTNAVLYNVCSYLAYQSRKRVLLIDANLRDPSVHKAFNLPNNIGLVDVLEGRASLENALLSPGTNLTVLPAGKTAANPVALLESDAMGDTLKTAQELYDLVFVDCSNLQDTRDASVLSASVDGVVIVLTGHQTRRLAIKSAVASLESVGANIIGVILNNRTYDIPRMIYERV